MTDGHPNGDSDAGVPSGPSAISGGSKRAVAAYLTLGALFTLGASLIWAINTIFLIRVGGLNLFSAMLVNTAFTISQMVFEVPTGVIADTWGRRISILLSLFILVVSTLLYVMTPAWGWGIWGFVLASVLLGLGYTFQTGATDAWLVDALDATGWDTPKDRVFAWGQIAMGAGMMLGSLLGGVLGQFDLRLPYVGRAVLLAVCFVVALAVVRDVGFEPRPLRRGTIAAETRAVFEAGVRYGWRSPVVRPLLWTSAISGLFLMYGFYAWQPYILELLGRDYIWLLGVVQAASSAAGIIGNSLVGGLSRRTGRWASGARLLVITSLVSAALIFGIGLVGVIWSRPGLLPAAAAIVLWLVWGVVYGIAGPVRMSFINAHIPSSQRATVLSLDAFFADGGAAAGQSAFGLLSERASISIAWLVGGALVAVTAPLYAISGSAAEDE